MVHSFVGVWGATLVGHSLVHNCLGLHQTRCGDWSVLVAHVCLVTQWISHSPFPLWRFCLLYAGSSLCRFCPHSSWARRRVMSLDVPMQIRLLERKKKCHGFHWCMGHHSLQCRQSACNKISRNTSGIIKAGQILKAQYITMSAPTRKN